MTLWCCGHAIDSRPLLAVSIAATADRVQSVIPGTRHVVTSDADRMEQYVEERRASTARDGVLSALGKVPSAMWAKLGGHAEPTALRVA
jgi:hypothetical protein